MSSQTNGGAMVPPASRAQRTFLDDVILTFSSPMAWLLVLALILTWSGVAIVLFDLLDYDTLAVSGVASPRLSGLPPPSAIAKRGMKARAGGRPLKARVAGVTVKEDTDWLEMIWTFVTGLIAPDDEEEGIHQLTETFTSFHSDEV
ncbi:triadin isoform X2 [Cynoglossus semilaevis]|uniref:triadin isoform X2 n=1 Tax=Cynoglossus semilaevis TaxID=244447 RepID=UPI0004952676|nr:triadin isoform X2 [Cynoglossus semilaevis]